MVNIASYPRQKTLIALVGVFFDDTHNSYSFHIDNRDINFLFYSQSLYRIRVNATEYRPFLRLSRIKTQK